MPFFDVSDVLLDPDFAQQFTVERFQQTVDENGRAVNTPVKLTLVGVIVPRPAILVQVEEGQRVIAKIEVYVAFRLTPGVGTVPADVVVYNQRYYRVESVDDFTDFGNGFNRVTCLEISRSNQPGILT
ncbi:MAG: hypothetical protein PHU06_06095 [Gallionella sp.]|nr:hypothetical protein [Gallionella sp.]MDD4958389.1 hypothetical protein [Gallionella sp.]